MLISVIIATYNRPERLENALQSLSLQTEVQFEAVVVNDGGADVSGIVSRWGRLMSVRYIPLPVNAGLARARNAAIRQARGDVICFLDDDDIVLAGHLQAGIQRLSRGDVDAVYTRVAVCDELVAAGSAPTVNQVKAHYRAGFDSRLLLICNFIPVNAVFIRRRDELPLVFDEALSRLEDWELWLRLNNRFGYRFAAVPLTTAVYHRVSGVSSMTGSSRRSADEAMRFRAAFQSIASRYPSNDALVQQGRALHDHFYGISAKASLAGRRETPFAYEQFVECMEAFVNQTLDAQAITAHLDSLLQT